MSSSVDGLAGVFPAATIVTLVHKNIGKTQEKKKGGGGKIRREKRLSSVEGLRGRAGGFFFAAHVTFYS